MKKIIKSPGPRSDGTLQGHCYDGTGLFECEFWEHNGTLSSRCALFGGIDGVSKHASEALVICNKIYGVFYEGPA